MTSSTNVYDVVAIEERHEYFPTTEGCGAFVSTQFTFLDADGNWLMTVSAFRKGTEPATRTVVTRASVTKGAETA